MSDIRSLLDIERTDLCKHAPGNDRDLERKRLRLTSLAAASASATTGRASSRSTAKRAVKIALRRSGLAPTRRRGDPFPAEVLLFVPCESCAIWVPAHGSQGRWRCAHTG
jgi:hypothetical protein